MAKRIVGLIEKMRAKKAIVEAFEALRRGEETISSAKNKCIEAIANEQDLFSWQSTDELLPEDSGLAIIEHGKNKYIVVIAYVRERTKYARPIILRREFKRGRWWWSNGYAGEEVEYWMAMPRRPSKQTISAAKETEDDNDL